MNARIRTKQIPYNRPESEFIDIELRLKSSKKPASIERRLKYWKFKYNFKWNPSHLSCVSKLSHGSNSLNSASELSFFVGNSTISKILVVVCELWWGSWTRRRLIFNRKNINEVLKFNIFHFWKKLRKSFFSAFYPPYCTGWIYIFNPGTASRWVESIFDNKNIENNHKGIFFCQLFVTKIFYAGVRGAASCVFCFVLVWGCYFFLFSNHY